MKIIGFVKKVLFVGLKILSVFANANSSSFISMNKQECKTRPQVANVNGDEPVLFPFSIEKLNAVVVVIILIIRMQKFVFRML